MKRVLKFLWACCVFYVLVSVFFIIFTACNQTKISIYFIERGYSFVPYIMNIILGLYVSYAVWNTFYKKQE